MARWHNSLICSLDDDLYEIDNNLIENSVEPQAWLTKVLERIPDHSVQRLEELLLQNLC